MRSGRDAGSSASQSRDPHVFLRLGNGNSSSKRSELLLFIIDEALVGSAENLKALDNMFRGYWSYLAFKFG